jgi:hypothetical protein
MRGGVLQLLLRFQQRIVDDQAEVPLVESDHFNRGARIEQSLQRVLLMKDGPENTLPTPATVTCLILRNRCGVASFRVRRTG